MFAGSLIMVNLFGQAEKKFVRQGNNNFRDNQFKEAEIEYRKALDKNPEMKAAEYNLGNTLYKQQQFDASVEKYTKLAESTTDKKALARYYYNLGNSLYESKKYTESINAYKNALSNDPGDMDAKHNLQMALSMLRQQEQLKNQQNNEQNNQNKPDNSNRFQQANNNQNKNQGDDKQNNDLNNSQNNIEKYGEISRDNAERILQALGNEEKNVMQKVQEQKDKVKKQPVDKDW